MKFKKKTKIKKWKLIILMGVIMAGLISGTYMLMNPNISITNLFSEKTSLEIHPQLAESNLAEYNNRLKFNYGEKEITLNLLAVVDNQDYSINDFSNWWMDRTAGGWKFANNISIPNNALGLEFTNNLNEFVFEIESVNTTIEQHGNGFRFYDKTNHSGFEKYTHHVYFDFSDIANSFNVPMSIIQTSEYKFNISFNFSNRNFNAGQIINLDPLINLTIGTSYLSFDSNVTSRTFPIAHITTIDKNLTFYMPMDVNSLSLIFDFSEFNTACSGHGRFDKVDGVYGKAINFWETGHYVDCQNSTGLHYISTENYTWSGWFNTSNIEQPQGIIDYQCLDDNSGIAIMLESQKLKLYNGNVDGFTAESSVLNQDTWYHFAITKNASVFIIYIDGQEDGIGYDAGFTQTSQNVSIGRTVECNGTNYFNGTIDEVAVWNKYFSASEILEMYNNQTQRFKDPPANQFFQIKDIEQNGSLNRLNFTTNTIQNGESIMRARIWEWNETHYNDSIDGELIPLADDGIVGWWHFDNRGGYDNSTDVFDWSGMGNNGTLIGDVYINMSGKFGGGAEFDGTADWIDCGDIDSYEFPEITISIWAKNKHGNLAQSPGQRMVDKGTNSVLFYWATNENIEFFVENSTGSDAIARSNVDLPDNNWHHYAGIYNGTNTLLYIDNVLQDTQGTLSGNIRNANNFLIGDDSGTNTWNGTIDEVIIWNRSLSSREIDELYIKGKFKYTTTEWETISEIHNQTQFNISALTNYSMAEINYSSGTYNFQTPILNYKLTFTSWYQSEIPPPVDLIYPIFSSNTTTPNSDTDWASGQTYEFNITILNSNFSVFFEFDGVNYTANNDTINMWNYTLTDLAGGTYTYKWIAFGNGTNNNINTSLTSYYTLNALSSSINLTINGTQGNYTADNRSSEVWINASFLTGQGELDVYLNGTINFTAYTNGMISNLTNLTVHNSTYNVSAIFEGNNNYSAVQLTYWINMTEYIPPPPPPVDKYPTFSNNKSVPESPATYSAGQTYRFNISVLDTNGSVEIEFDGVNYTATNVTPLVWNWSIDNLATGTYNLIWSSYGNGSSEYYNASLRSFYTINPAVLITTASKYLRLEPFTKMIPYIQLNKTSELFAKQFPFIQLNNSIDFRK